MEQTKYKPDRLLGQKEDNNTTALLIIILALTVLLAIYSYFFAIIRVSGNSMLDTLQDKQFVVFRTNGIKIERNNIVTIYIEQIDKVIIKRVVAVEGDKVLFMYDEDGYHISLYLCKNGENSFSKCDEPYIKERMTNNADYNHAELCPYIADISSKDASAVEKYYIEIPEDSFYYLGDNRNISQDAREHGIKKESDVIGKAVRYIEIDSFQDRFLSFMYGLFTKE